MEDLAEVEVGDQLVDVVRRVVMAEVAVEIDILLMETKGAMVVVAVEDGRWEVTFITKPSLIRWYSDTLTWLLSQVYLIFKLLVSIEAEGH